MTPLTRRWLGIYLTLLLVLSLLGSYNQTRYGLQSDLILEKAALQEQVKLMRAAAAPINGALAVPEWAYQQGMIPASQAGQSRQVAPLEAPTVSRDEGKVTVRTQWR